MGSSKSKYIDQFFIRGRHNNLDIYYLSESYFDLPKRTIRNNSNKVFLFNQTLKGIANVYRDVGGYDMSHDEVCRKSWEEDYIYLCVMKKYAENHGKKIIFIFVMIDLKKEIGEDIVFVMKAKTFIWNALLKRNRFKNHKCCIQLKTEKIWKN